MWSEMETTGVVREPHFNRNVLVYADRPKNVNDLLQRTASQFSEREALVMYNRRLTYKEMLEFVEHIASRLYYDYGVRKGERVAILLGNCIEYALIFFACSRIGAIAVPLNTRLVVKEIQFMLKQSDCSMIVTDIEFAVKVEGNDSISTKFIVGGEQEGFIPFDRLCSSTKTVPFIEIDEEDPLYIMYTSGTTGVPKGAVGSHLGVIHSVMSYSRIMRTTEEDRSLDAVPLFHVTGLVGQLIHMVYVGGTNVIIKRFRSAEFIQVLSEEKITFTFNVPTVYVLLLSDPSFHNYRYDTVRILAYGGAPMSPHTIQQLKKEFPGVHLHNAYGATETTSPCTVTPLGYLEHKMSSVGMPIPVIEVKIVNHNGETCATSEVGELWVKGPNVVREYWNNKEANDKSFVGDYWCSGDIAMIDEDGFVSIMDRAKDMINRGGEKIFSIEVENILLSHPNVLEVAIVGIPDHIFGEQVKAVIVAKPGAMIDEAEIQNFAKLHLADYKIPRVIEFCSELPRNPGGKVLKNLLRNAVS